GSVCTAYHAAAAASSAGVPTASKLNPLEISSATGAAAAASGKPAAAIVVVKKLRNMPFLPIMINPNDRPPDAVPPRPATLNPVPDPPPGQHHQPCSDQPQHRQACRLGNGKGRYGVDVDGIAV